MQDESLEVIELTQDEETLWDLKEEMLKVCQMLENAQNEVDAGIADDIRKTADAMAANVLLVYRNLTTQLIN